MYKRQAKISAASAAARRPAALQRGAGHPDFGMDVSLPAVLSVVRQALPALHTTVFAAHAAYGRLLDGQLASEDGDRVWAVFQDADSPVCTPRSISAME